MIYLKKLNIHKKTASYYLISLFVSGICGYISIGNLLKLSFSQVITHPFLLYLIVNSCFVIWLGFGIYKNFIKKETIKSNDILFHFVILPCLIFSLIGHMGNGDAIAIIFGESFGTLYYYLLIGLYVYSFVLVLKNKKRG